jgi:protein-L-isoaspartate(D-aspartate) O-methyltransferase
MVRDQLVARGITDTAVLEAMGQVKRHEFVDEALQSQAYGDNALPIGYGQTISQPVSVARMTSALKVEPGMRVLEIGTGSGYQAAVLAHMGAEVYTVERVKPLYLKAMKRLNALRYFQVKVRLTDGTLGWEEEAPFHRILVTAGGPEVPGPLLAQLGDSGMLLMPLGSRKRDQRLIRIRQEEGKWFKQDLGPAQFVDLVGAHGWEDCQT